jgi:DNA topoisomerase-1
VSEKEISLKSGRFGPYVTDGTINASLPRGVDPEGVTVDDAVNLLEARAARLSAEEASGAKRRAAGRRARPRRPRRLRAAAWGVIGARAPLFCSRLAIGAKLLFS